MNKTFKLLKIVFGLTLIVGLLPSCGGKPNPYAKTEEEYQEISKLFAADESVSPVMDEEMRMFYNKTHRGPLFPLYISEQEAVNMLLNQDVFLVFTTRRLTSEEENYIKNRKYNIRTFPLAYDALALVVNSENPDTTITVDEFKKILTGSLTSWKELNSESAFDTIHVAFDNPTSSTVRFCNDSILRGEAMKTSGNIQAVSTSQAVIDYVENHKDALGIVGSNWLDDRRDTTNLTYKRNIKVMKVGYSYMLAVKPDQYYIATGDYPFIRTLYALCTDPRTEGAPRAFANFCWLPEPGQRIFFRAGLFPARAEYSVRDVIIR